jgi:ribosomal protein S18 acetylase RimI-like enzyme
MTVPQTAIRTIASGEIDARRAELHALLVDAIDGGASVGFVLPIDASRIDAFWRDIAADVAAGTREVIVAERGRAIVGSVQLAVSWKPNQPHRADVEKLLVARGSRREGIGRLLMDALEARALAGGRWLLTLDTRTDSDADRLYRRLEWTEVGTIPDYAADPDGTLAACTFFYKRLAPAGEARRER